MNNPFNGELLIVFFSIFLYEDIVVAVNRLED